MARRRSGQTGAANASVPAVKRLSSGCAAVSGGWAEHKLAIAPRTRLFGFRAWGFCVPSGAVEAGCKRGHRCAAQTRRSCTGPWPARTPIIGLRCCKLSGRSRISGNDDRNGRLTVNSGICRRCDAGSTGYS